MIIIKEFILQELFNWKDSIPPKEEVESSIKKESFFMISIQYQSKKGIRFEWNLPISLFIQMVKKIPGSIKIAGMDLNTIPIEELILGFSEKIPLQNASFSITWENQSKFKLQILEERKESL